MNAPALGMLAACEAGGFDTKAMLVGIAIGIALGIAAVATSRRAADQDDFPSDPYEREQEERERSGNG